MLARDLHEVRARSQMKGHSGGLQIAGIDVWMTVPAALRRRVQAARESRRADPQTTVHPQTVIGHFGSWNAAKRRAGLVPRRFATREELLARLRELGDQLGRTPTARDLEQRRGSMPSKSLYWHTFGSLTNALREAGFDVPVGEERLARAIEQGVYLAIRSGRLPKFADWAEARRSDPTMLTEWQVYRMFEARRGAWSTFQFLVREQLAIQGVEVAPDGALNAES
jgi:hypothetical protein